MGTKIGILGSGVVAESLASGFINNGYQVKIGSGNPDKLQNWKHVNSGEALTGSFADAAAFGEILVLAVKGAAAVSVLEAIDSKLLDGKIIIDTTNPIANEPINNNVLSFFTTNNSLLEILQEKFPEARFVKAFNSIGAGLLVNPSFGGTKPSMFICGNDEEAKQEVAEIVNLFGFEAEDLGKQEAARAIEPLCILWCIEGFAKNVWDKHAFKILRKA